MCILNLHFEENNRYTYVYLHLCWLLCSEHAPFIHERICTLHILFNLFALIGTTNTWKFVLMFRIANNIDLKKN